MYVALCHTVMSVTCTKSSGEGEDNASLRRAVTKLSELETKMEAVHLEQSDNDLFTLGETIKDYIAIIQSAKVNRLSSIDRVDMKGNEVDIFCKDRSWNQRS